MNLMPIADQGQHKKEKRDHKKPGSFGSVESVSMMPGRAAIGLLGGWHGPIVALETINWAVRARIPLWLSVVPVVNPFAFLELISPTPRTPV
jgi:hypothetical protein